MFTRILVAVVSASVLGAMAPSAQAATWHDADIYSYGFRLYRTVLFDLGYRSSSDERRSERPEMEFTCHGRRCDVSYDLGEVPECGPDTTVEHCGENLEPAPLDQRVEITRVRPGTAAAMRRRGYLVAGGWKVRGFAVIDAEGNTVYAGDKISRPRARASRGTS